MCINNEALTRRLHEVIKGHKSVYIFSKDKQSLLQEHILHDLFNLSISIKGFCAKKKKEPYTLLKLCF